MLTLFTTDNNRGQSDPCFFPATAGDTKIMESGEIKKLFPVIVKDT